jgi:hypothetical protein
MHSWPNFSFIFSILHLITLNDTHAHSTEFLWTRVRPVAETSTDKTPHTHTHTHTRSRNPCPGGVLTRNPGMCAAADPLLTPRGHQVRPSIPQFVIRMAYVLHTTTEQYYFFSLFFLVCNPCIHRSTCSSFHFFFPFTVVKEFY